MRPATLLLISAILFAYYAELMLGGDAFCQAHGLVSAHPSVSSALSSMFLHDPEGYVHVGGNALFLLVFGTLVERSIGSLRFMVLYFAAGLGGAVCHVMVDPSATTPMVGCSGCVFGVMAACAMIYPKTAVFVGVFALCNLIGLFAPELVGLHDVSVGAHVGGFVVGAAMMRVAFLRKMEEA